MFDSSQLFDSTHTGQSRRSARRCLTSVALVIALCAGSSAVGAQTAEIESARAQRDEVRRQAAEAAAALDPLMTEDAELEAAVAALDLHVATLETQIDATRQAIEAAEQDAAGHGARIVEVQSEITALRERLRVHAIDAYLDPGSTGLAHVLSSTDLSEAAHKQALLDTITGREVDLIDQLRAAEAEVIELEELAQAAIDRVEARRADEERQLTELEESRAEQQRLRDALAERIAEVQAEIDALAAEEAEITSTIQALIVEDDQRRAAEAEARRRAEEAARLASLSEGRVGVGSPAGAGDSSSGGSSDVTTSPPLPTPPTAVGGLSWPVAGVVTSGYGPRWGRVHQGIDISAPTGSPVAAAASGTVISAGSNGGYGNIVIIDHGGGLSTVYAHLNEIWVSSGQAVSVGSGIGSVGCSGSCTGPHLHFETRVLGIPQDPMLYL